MGNEQMLHIIDVRRERVLAAAEFPNGLKIVLTIWSERVTRGASRPMSDSFGPRVCLSRCRRSSKIPIRMCSIGLVVRWRLIPGRRRSPEVWRDSEFRRC